LEKVVGAWKELATMNNKLKMKNEFETIAAAGAATKIRRFWS
tara:strand:- start:222 stop:347 length:126 start_codon:yes stop_codon:yes gene_type:complete